MRTREPLILAIVFQNISLLPTHKPLRLPCAAPGIQRHQSAADLPALPHMNPGTHPTIHPPTHTPVHRGISQTSSEHYRHFCFSPCTGPSTYASFSCCNGVACADCLEVMDMGVMLRRSEWERGSGWGRERERENACERECERGRGRREREKRCVPSSLVRLSGE